jgi:hypothetical protein
MSRRTIRFCASQAGLVRTVICLTYQSARWEPETNDKQSAFIDVVTHSSTGINENADAHEGDTVTVTDIVNMFWEFILYDTPTHTRPRIKNRDRKMCYIGEKVTLLPTYGLQSKPTHAVSVEVISASLAVHLQVRPRYPVTYRPQVPPTANDHDGPLTRCSHQPGRAREQVLVTVTSWSKLAFLPNPTQADFDL